LSMFINKAESLECIISDNANPGSSFKCISHNISGRIYEKLEMIE